MSFITPDVQLGMYFDERDRVLEEKSAERKKAAAERLMADPLSLAFVIAEAIEEDPQTWGYALQALRDGEAFQIAALAGCGLRVAVMDKDNGGHAFPVQFAIDGNWQKQPSPEHTGMSLRDYFAAHCDQPGAAEIVAEAGLIHGSDGKVYTAEDDLMGRPFNAWYASISPAERFRLYAKVRYRMADAMLEARK